ncbi:MAG: hypothetical protein C0405_03630 [Desulfovibrio sp.]|nr:hypothetical protein [Desulfovibrio sp.]
MTRTPRVDPRRARRRCARKARPLEFKARDARFRILVEHSCDLFFSMRFPEGRFEYLSPAYETATGYRPEEYYANPNLMFRVIAPEWREQVGAWLEEHRQGRAPETCEYQILDRHGRTRWLHQRQVLVPTPDGQGLLLQGVATDVTELRETQQALRQSESHFRQLIEAWPELVMLSVNLDAGRHEYVSPSMEYALGYAPQEFYDDPGLGLRMVAPQWQEQAREWLAEIRSGRLRPSYEFELVHKNGQHRFIHQVASPRPHAPGQDLVVQFTFRDTTEERKAREALRQSEEHFRALTESWADQVVMRVNLATGRPEYVSPSVERMFGHTPEAMLNSPPQQIVAPEWGESLAEWLEENRRGVMRPEYQHEILDAWGNRRWVSARGVLLNDDQGQPVAVQLVLVDITERRRLEEELHSSKAFLDCVIEQSPVSMWISDEHGTLIRSNQALRELFKVSEAEVVGRFNIFQDNQALEQGLMPQIRRVYEQGGTARFMLPYDTAHIKGLDLARSSATFLDVTISAVQDAKGRTTNLIVQHLDISEYKRTEAALARNEALLQAMLRNLPLDFWARDRQQRILLQSDESVRLWGDLTQSSLADRQFDQQTLELWRSNNRRALAGEIISEERACTIRSGEQREFHNIVAPIRDGAEILGLIGINIDVTERKRDEERIRASLREKDALLHEVHHRVKNNLQVVSSLLDMARRRLASPEARLSLAEMRGKVQAMSLIHAQLHNAGSAGGINLERFVRALFHQLREAYAGGLDLSLWLQLGDLTLALDQAVPLGLALNEALANVFKHACPPDQSRGGQASRVEIRAERDESGRVTIAVQDDGPGLPEGLDPASADSLGMKLMFGLVRHQLRGELEFAFAAPGLCVRLCFQPHIVK